MRKLIVALFLGLLASPAMAETDDVFLPSKTIVKSSATIYNVAITSYVMTRIDSPQLSGSFVAEIQNNDTADDACCSFDIQASTVTSSATGKSCRVVAKNGGTWVVSRWWQNLALYCQTLKTSAAAKIVVVQGR